MPIQSYKLGPGTLTLGAAGVMDVSCQITSGRVVPEEVVNTTDAVPVLCGEELPAEDTVSYTYALEATLLQDLAAAGVVDWSWTNKGTEQPFEFIPNTVAARKVTGTVRVIPIAIGGEVGGARPTSDIAWKCTGAEPVFGAVA